MSAHQCRRHDPELVRATARQCPALDRGGGAVVHDAAAGRCAGNLRGRRAVSQRSLRRCRPGAGETAAADHRGQCRSEEHTSELQSLMRISYAVFCLKKKKITKKYCMDNIRNTHNMTDTKYVDTMI